MPGIRKYYSWIYWIKLLAGIALLAILYYKISHRESILSALAAAKWEYLLLCLALLIPNVYLAHCKWRYLLKSRFTNLPDREIFGSLLFGYTLGLLTPGRLGELGRGLFFKNLDRLTITGLNILDKAANQVVIFTLGGGALMLLIGRYGAWNFSDARWVLIAGCAALLIMWGLVLNPRLIKKLLLLLQQRLPENSRRRSMLRAFDDLTFAHSLTILGLSLAWYLVIIMQYHVLINAFTGVSLTQSFLAVSAMLFIKTLLPFTFGDLGIREGVAVFFFQIFSVSEAAVFNGSLLIFVINFLLPALCGAYYLLRTRTPGKENHPSARFSAKATLQSFLANKE